MSNVVMLCLNNPHIPQALVGEDGCESRGRARTVEVVGPSA